MKWHTYVWWPLILLAIAVVVLTVALNPKPPQVVDEVVQQQYHRKTDTYVFWKYAQPATFEAARQEVRAKAAELQQQELDRQHPMELDDTSVENAEGKIFLARIHVRPK